MNTKNKQNKVQVVESHSYRIRVPCSEGTSGFLLVLSGIPGHHQVQVEFQNMDGTGTRWQGRYSLEDLMEAMTELAAVNKFSAKRGDGLRKR